MDRRDPEAVEEARPELPRVAGLRLALSLSFVVGLGAALVIAGMFSASRWGAEAPPPPISVDAARAEWSSLQARLDTAEREAAEARVRAIVSTWTLRAERARNEVGGLELEVSDPSGIELGLIDPKRGRIVAWVGASATVGSTISLALPGLSDGARRAGHDDTVVVNASDSVIAMGPLLDDGRRVVAKLVRAAPAPLSDPLAPIAASLERGASKSPRVEAIEIGALLGMVLGLALALIWAWSRLGRPWAEAASAAGRFVHGDHEARAPISGGRDARDLALTINGVIEHATRLEAAGFARVEADARILTHAARGFGQGDLGAAIPEVDGPLRPLADAFELSRVQLCERLERLHKESSQVAMDVSSVTVGARRVGHGAAEQAELMGRVAAYAESGHEELRAQSAQLGAALERLTTIAAEQRKSAQQHRAEMTLAARRAQDLKRVVAQLEGALGSLSVLEDCLGLLDEFKSREPSDEREREGAKVSSTRAALAIRRGREAIESIRRETGRLSDDTASVARMLESTAAGEPAFGPEVERAVTSALHESGLGLLRVSERLLDGIRGLERSVEMIRGGADEIFSSASRAKSAGPRLGLALAELRLGDYLESDILDRLERARAELGPDLVGADGTSQGGEAMIEQVVQAADEAKARLARLIAATETTLEVMRRV